MEYPDNIKKYALELLTNGNSGEIVRRKTNKKFNVGIATNTVYEWKKEIKR
jgi:hypothetical protein